MVRLTLLFSLFTVIHQYEIAIIHNIDFAEDVINMIYVIIQYSSSLIMCYLYFSDSRIIISLS